MGNAIIRPPLSEVPLYLVTRDELKVLTDVMEEVAKDDPLHDGVFYWGGLGVTYALFRVDVAAAKYRFASVSEYSTIKGRVPIHSEAAGILYNYGNKTKRKPVH